MSKTAEAVSIGHPDKISDYISSYILDRMIEQDPHVKYAVEVMIKNNTITLGGEITRNTNLTNLKQYVLNALSDIGYTRQYYKYWGDDTINPDDLHIINLIGEQSPEIASGVNNNGWGDQGVFVGYACNDQNNIGYAHYLARKLNNAIYNYARNNYDIGLDIKTQITVDDDKNTETVIVAAPMRDIKLKEKIKDIISTIIPGTPKNIIINGTGIYTRHASIADCGITGRKLACDFYSTYSPIGGGAPWTKDGSKADLTLNLYARYLAMEHLGDNDECVVYLSSCIGKSDMPSAMIKTIKDNIITYHDMWSNVSPNELIELFKLNTPIFAKLCKNGLISIN